MIAIEVVQGAQVDRVVQANNLDGSAVAVGDLLDSDMLTAVVWAGQNQAPLFAFTPIWYTNKGTQTGYEEGQVLLTISAANSALLDAAGVYQCQIFATRNGAKGCIGWCTVTCLPSAGTGVQSIATYCTDADVFNLASWIADIVETATDQEGFYPQRVRVRQWIDRLIVSRARPLSYIYNINTPLTPWGPVEGPNYVMQGYLQAGYLLRRDLLAEICARKTIALICEKQISLVEPDPWLKRARHWHATAHQRLSCYRAEINISSAPIAMIDDATGGGAQALATLDGLGGVSGAIPMQFGSGYTAPTVRFAYGTGVGAAAVPIVSNGQIVGYTVTIPGTGYYWKQTPDIAFNMGMISWR